MGTTSKTKQGGSWQILTFPIAIALITLDSLAVGVECCLLLVRLCPNFVAVLAEDLVVE